MIGGLLFVVLLVAGAMQAPIWAVPVVAVLIANLCGGVPFLRGRFTGRVTGRVAWALVAAGSALAYGLGYGAGWVLIG